MEERKRYYIVEEDEVEIWKRDPVKTMIPEEIIDKAESERKRRKYKSVEAVLLDMLDDVVDIWVDDKEI